MVTCEHCGYDNPDEEILCVRCGLPVRALPFSEPPFGEDVGATRRLVLSAATSVPRWGTARLGDERRLLFHIRGHDKPLVIQVVDRVELGRTDTQTGEVPDISLDEYGASELGVSRRHAALLIEDGSLKVVDLGSANATFINGQKLMPSQSRILRDGDELRLGKMVVRVQFA